MDQATLSMIENLHKNTGKTLDQWVAIVRKENFAKHGEIIKYLQESHALTYGFANLVAHKSKGSDAGSASDPAALIDSQYYKKEHLRPIYDFLMSEVMSFGNDIDVAPKKVYVSLRRKKQFAILQPASKTRFEIGINLKGHEASGKLETINSTNAMCSHKITISDITEIDREVIDWLKLAYEEAG